ncbi:MAG: glutamate synthase large subunit [Candidatus Omnitrophica bacterium]|nr:glutamate synthase large subunit [Candidatus Omnitrophota bacterium]
MNNHNFPPKQGLYDPIHEKDACGVGFVCNIKGNKNHSILKDGLVVLKKLSHRGAVGADPDTGDGAGILIQIPDKFLRNSLSKQKINLPQEGDYGVGLIFLPRNKKGQKTCKDIFKKIIAEEGQTLVAWRRVPVDNSVIGKDARESEPSIWHLFIGKKDKELSQIDFERKLYLIRRRIENKIFKQNLMQKSFFYISNLSSRTLAYKGLLMPEQVEDFFLDLKDKSLKTALALVHSRYSTNTFPSWDLAQPFRFLAHNGEINTLRGNVNWMKARESQLASEVFGNEIDKIKPILTEGASDSAIIDNAFELLSLSGRSLAHSMMMLIPSAWENDIFMDSKLRDFYRYHACFCEPWDGPAAIAFTDGLNIGAVLDRNGLRPARYIVTKTNKVIMASEVGVLGIKAKDILYSGRLQPGKIFFIDTKKKKIIQDQAIKEEISGQAPYGRWVKNNLVNLSDLESTRAIKRENNLLPLLACFGYSREDLREILKPMAEDAKEPTGSMGNDTPLALFSKQPQLLFNYFKQLFAQVTNPAIDPIREEIVMSLDSYLGSQQNLLTETAKHCHKLYLQRPILSNYDLLKIESLAKKDFKIKKISLLFEIDKKNNFKKSLNQIIKEAESAVKNGYDFIVLTDRGVNRKKAALPSLLAIGAVHHHLVKNSLRTQVGLIAESAEVRQTHHFSLLFGYGADCINPYLAYQAIENLVDQGQINLSKDQARKNYRRAVEKGVKKILSKMGISTLSSYRGAQIFESLGLSEEIINKCFCGTTSRIGGLSFDQLAQETILRHLKGYPERNPIQILPSGGVYAYRRDGQHHLWRPESIAALQDAARNNDYQRYQKFAKIINDQSPNLTTLRAGLKFKKRKAINLNQVESLQSILQRFATGAMSFGSISKGAHQTLAIAMNRIGGKSNTGEGGEDPQRFIQLPSGDSLRSAIKQVASGRFGVTANYLANADEIQIKIAQGAKPGEGGQLPGHKVSAVIAKTRYTTPGVTLISPPPHHDIYSIEDLAQLIFDLKNANPQARISVKLVSEIGVGTIAAGVAKGHADMILISGGDGGTGASPKSSIYHAGLPWELGLSETHQTLVLNNLRNRVRLQTDGQMRTGRDVIMAAILGAEEFGFCTAALIVSGCVMLRHCHLNNCALGIATQDEILEKRFQGNPDHLVNYFHFIAKEAREIMAKLGVKKIDQLIGRTDLVEPNRDIIPKKAKNIDYSKILYKPKVSKKIGVYCQKKQNHKVDLVLDKKLIKLSKQSLRSRKITSINIKISNTDRTTGGMLSNEVVKRFGESALAQDTININFKGVAGQSFGAWLAKGITFRLDGLANDYVGKGISGGKIIIRPDPFADYLPNENIIIGNTSFYGAISGQAFINGIAGERFCIRNSGLETVVEGVGDHGCEYMTGGIVVVIGQTGRNFAAGMSGGVAYIYERQETFEKKCNLGMVDIEKVSQEDKSTVDNLLMLHKKYTGSAIASRILDNFENEFSNFIKVVPIEYKKVLDQKRIEEKLGVSESSDG